MFCASHSGHHFIYCPAMLVLMKIGRHWMLLNGQVVWHYFLKLLSYLPGQPASLSVVLDLNSACRDPPPPPPIHGLSGRRDPVSPPIMPSLAMSHLLLSDVPTDPMATIIPPELYMPIPLFLAYAALYRAAAPRLHTEKQRAYILSAVTSFGMTLMSLPFTAAYAHSGLAVAFEQAQHGWRAEVVRFGTIVFGVYLVADVSCLAGNGMKGCEGLYIS